MADEVSLTRHSTPYNPHDDLSLTRHYTPYHAQLDRDLYFHHGQVRKEDSTREEMKEVNHTEDEDDLFPDSDVSVEDNSCVKKTSVSDDEVKRLQDDLYSKFKTLEDMYISYKLDLDTKYSNNIINTTRTNNTHDKKHKNTIHNTNLTSKEYFYTSYDELRTLVNELWSSIKTNSSSNLVLPPQQQSENPTAPSTPLADCHVCDVCEVCTSPEPVCTSHPMSNIKPVTVPVPPVVSEAEGVAVVVPVPTFDECTLLYPCPTPSQDQDQDLKQDQLQREIDRLQQEKEEIQQEHKKLQQQETESDGDSSSSSSSSSVSAAVLQPQLSPLTLPLPPDLAQIVAGATVLHEHTSSTYIPHGIWSMVGWGVKTLMTLGFECGVGVPKDALINDLQPGKCWAMHGSEGMLTVKLVGPVHIRAITIEHLPSNLVTEIGSAPKDFIVYGYDLYSDSKIKLLESSYIIKNSKENEEQEQEQYEYDFAQTFPIETIYQNTPFQVITLEILNNYGHVDFTCLYKFRVHANLAV
eukprot:gene1397-2689_t